jgi:hypothetical protein
MSFILAPNLKIKIQQNAFFKGNRSFLRKELVKKEKNELCHTLPQQTLS